MTTKTATSPTTDPQATVKTGAVPATRTTGSGSQPPAGPRGPGLGFKFFVAAAGLVLAALGSAIAFGSWRANTEAEKAIREALSHVPEVYGVYRSNLETQFRANVRTVAGEPGTKALPSIYTTASPADLESEEGRDKIARTFSVWTHDQAAILKAKTVFLFDRTGAVLSRSDKNAGEDFLRPFKSASWVAEPIEKWSESAAMIREGKVLSMVASVPILTGNAEMGEARLEGVLAAVFPFDEARARALQGITNGQVGFLANTAKAGEPPKLEVAAQTPGFSGEALLSALAGKPDSVKQLVGDGQEIGPLDLVVAGENRIAAAVPIKNSRGETLGAFAVSRSRDEETAAFRTIRNALLGVGLVALLVSIPVSFAMGRRIARPLQQLAEGAQAIREGNLEVKLPEGGSDEVGFLARAFSQMLGELKEKAALEQLLGEMQRRPGDVTAAGVLPEARTATLEALAMPAGTEGPVVGHSFANRYDVLSVLGKGGMGAVYRAFDRELEEDVALKVLTPDAFEEGTQAVATLKQEIRLARKITHRNVVRTHDMGEAGGLRFITMEYVPGTTLRELVDRKGAVALAPGLQISKQVCRGLGAVHEAGIIHRDIKPHNIMVLPNGVVKLMDFGIALQKEGMGVVEEGGQTVGTPYYMSPEQVRGDKLDARSDLYSVGVVLYELFTGVRPIEGKEPVEVMRRHLNLAPLKPSQHNPELPASVDKLILWCLAKRMEERPQTARAVYQGLMSVA